MDSQLTNRAGAKSNGTEKGESRYTHHPWRALLVMLGMVPVCYGLVGMVLYGILRRPIDISNMRSFSTIMMFTVGDFLAYVLAPFFLHIPKGKRTFREYLDDIRLTRTRPFFRLLLLTLSCVIILILCQGSFSIIYRISQGYPITKEFIFRVYDLSLALPPTSMILFAQFFSMFEEVAMRGIFLTMLLEKHSQRTAIIYSAIAFGVLHSLSVFAGKELIHTLGQVVWAFLFGLFYGYLFIKSGSLLPQMIIHWLSNVFQAPLAHYYGTAPAAVNALGGIFGYGLAAILLIVWVRFFATKWLSEPKNGLSLTG
ncbi:MAG: type II CAAX endopeptidase family protein [Chloroflexi bacterium]|nr:type II CAAX endopeptidase family protein [Chloroflexota bacterium]